MTCEQSCIRQTCNANVSEAVTLNECSNECTKPIGEFGPLVAKIPVVIAEPEVQIDVESIIELEQPALEIKRIKKNVFLTQCKLIDTDSHKSGKLFLSGYVRKNIEYATVGCEPNDNGAISGDIVHTTVNVPFRCVTKIHYINPPVTCKTGFSKEIQYFTDQLVGCDPCAQNIMGRNPCEQDFQHYECFTERVFCELEDVKIFEEDIHRNPMSLGCDFPAEHVFESFTEKMVLFVKLKVLQKQQVYVPEPYKNKKCSDYEDKWNWKSKPSKRHYR
ncbi:CsxC family protein [Petroclostridium sp. X23]|uniref:CsxC family protein n=1 Tax=Petroclostridium sp. X23 TaxID=3045146 RepID=UPI0024AE7C60|nr:hypothetical protein [Petroclostridium sp. X23]WHH59603.1 hypothetical protein QKW49_02245 [Petroclostridium sp. X23]